MTLPLTDVSVRSRDWPAARWASRLLIDLGASDVGGERIPLDSGEALRSNERRCFRPATTPEADWRTAGLDELCGRGDGPRLPATGAAATLARAAGMAIELLTGRPGDPTPRLGERAALLGLCRRGSISAGGAARLLRSSDGWVALNLPRASDAELIPALVEAPLAGVDSWSAVERWAGHRAGVEIEARARLLGLAVALVPPRPAAPVGVPWRLARRPGEPCPPPGRPLRVVNLGALWAGPLCAQLLCAAGLSVTDVESVDRPDHGAPVFYRALHEGHRRRLLDFGSSSGRAALAAMLHDADVVIEASRPRALEALGCAADAIMADRRPRVWLRITGHGPAQPDRIAFGDDAAAGGGLLGWDAVGPVFAGDAIADPLTGILGALVVLACIRTRTAWEVDLAMTDVARYAAAGEP